MTDVLVLVLNAAWQAVVFFLLGQLIARLIRRAPAHFEYLVWVSVLLAASATPWLSFATSGTTMRVIHHWVWQSDVMTDFGLWLNGGGLSVRRQVAAPGHWSLLPLLSYVYLTFVAAQLSGLVWGSLQVRRIVRQATECVDRRVLRIGERFLCGESRRVVKILVSKDARVPFAIGLARSAIVLPNALLADATDDELVVVLAHEFAHVERNDWIFNILRLLLSIPISFHPCVVLMRKKVEASREAACDEFAAGCMASAAVYARALLDLAGKLAQPQPSLVAAYKGAALGVLDGSTLGDRIRRLMDRSPRLSTKQTRLIISGGLGILLATCVAVTGVALALPSHQPEGNSPKTYAWTRDGSVAGVWQGQFTDYHTGTGKIGHTPIYLQLQENGGTFSGVIGPDASGAVPLQSAQLDGNKLHLTTTMKRGDESVSWKLDFTVNGDQMSGTGHALRSDQHSWDVEANLTRKQ
jgi:beta-lactamase regulating signal transducer with metallopeptidase domain